MKTIWMLLFVSSISMLTAGCKKHEAEPPSNSGSAIASGSAMGSSTMGSAVAAGSAAMTGSAAAMGSAATPDVPTTADFEAQATTDITDKNLESQLDAIEKDLGK